jgi:hypothetical protein
MRADSMHAAGVALAPYINAPLRFAHMTCSPAHTSAAVNVVIVRATRDRAVEMHDQPARTRRRHEAHRNGKARRRPAVRNIAPERAICARFMWGTVKRPPASPLRRHRRPFILANRVTTPEAASP